LAPLDAVTAAESTLLPGDAHGDPADRFLIATARTHGVALATRDEQIIEYGRLGFVRVVEL
jgi:PIN domain nuclease of toxin-antitoxin system